VNEKSKTTKTVMDLEHVARDQRDNARGPMVKNHHGLSVTRMEK
jgi:hypothetical protein